MRRPDTLQVLFVCTGNICRSPVAEQVFRAQVAAAGLPVSVRSVGTRALVGGTMTDQAKQLSLRYGGNPDRHRPRQLTESTVAESDLVLCASREHRAEVVRLYTQSALYAYTINQFARFIAAGHSEETDGQSESLDQRTRLDLYLESISESRGEVPQPHQAEDDDIVDPYGQSREIYDQVGQAISASIATISNGMARALGETL